MTKAPTWRIRLRQRRNELHLTQPEVAEKCGVEPATYSHWETGRREPSLEKIDKLAAALGSHPAWILFGVLHEPDSSDIRDVRRIFAQLTPAERHRAVEILRAAFRQNGHPGTQQKKGALLALVWSGPRDINMLAPQPPVDTSEQPGRGMGIVTALSGWDSNGSGIPDAAEMCAGLVPLLAAAWLFVILGKKIRR